MGKRKNRKDHDALRVFNWAEHNGCFFDRVQSPSEPISRSPEWVVKTSNMLPLTDLLSGAWDLVVSQLLATEEQFQVWKHMVTPGAPAAIYELDDWILGVEPSNTQAYEFYADPTTRRVIETSLWVADAVIVSSEALREKVLPFNENVFVFPNYLPERYLRTPSLRTPDRVVAGYGGGSSHLLDVAENAPGIRRALLENRERVLFRNYGQHLFNEFGFNEATDRVPFEFVPWQSDKGDYLRNLNIDIGLCPLRDSDFNRCKTPIKALEYAFCGVPTIASNVTPYKEFVVDGVTGYLVDTADEWAAAIDELVNDHAKRFELGRNAHQFAKSWTSEGNSAAREAFYRAVIKERDRIKRPKFDSVNDYVRAPGLKLPPSAAVDLSLSRGA
jgi:hypothetical protein